MSLEGKKTEDIRRIRNEVLILRGRHHRNLTELLGSFESNILKPAEFGEPSPTLYMIFPRALMDMDRWLKEAPTSLLASGGMSPEQHIYSAAIFGLISGLSYLHSEINGQVGYHGDLKPKNILLFQESQFVWKISDFGCSNLKPFQETSTENKATTDYWAPPEFFEGSSKNLKRHARSHDIYSMGCMFLTLATLVVHGREENGSSVPAGIPGFQQWREQYPDDPTSDNQGYFFNSKRACSQWIANLKGKNARASIKDRRLEPVLRVIEEMLLPYKARISAWEAEIYLFDATGECENELSSRSRSLVDQFKSRVDLKESILLDKLNAVIQSPRDIDLEMEVTPVTRAIKWNRKEYLGVMKTNNWYDISPKSTKQLQKRQCMPSATISTLPNDEIWKDDPMYGNQSNLDKLQKEFGSSNVVGLCGLGGLG